MKSVNPYFLRELLTPLTGLADDDLAVESFRDLAPNDTEGVCAVIRRFLVPHYERLSPTARDKAKLALGYYLSKPRTDFSRVFNSCLLPFPPPDDARLFFLWLWQELFPSESYELSNSETFREVPDIHEPNRY